MEDNNIFDDNLIMVIYSHLSDLQELGADRQRINLIKSLVSELANKKQTISKNRLKELTTLYIK